MNNTINLILNSDSYKFSQFNQYPPNTEYVSSYIESRGGRWNETLFFGLQAFLREYLTTPITKKDIEEARNFTKLHGVPFNEEGWNYILKNHNGYMPVKIDAVKEGTIIPTRNILLSITNTDPKCFWITSYLETALLRAIWYPTTVATNSRACKKVISKYLLETGSPDQIDFKLNDFGFRGVSSYESAMLGGMAHLVNFKGTDTIAGIQGAMKYYDSSVCGYSIPAMEHSTVTSWGEGNEVESFSNMLDNYAKPGALVACVSDSYNIYNACEKIWGEQLREKVISSGATVVVRPDSGNPSEVVVKCLQLLDSKFGHTVNDKGFKVLNYVRVIQGDGVNEYSIGEVLEATKKHGYSADNIAFGMGGELLQKLDRDTLKFAMKASAVRVNGEWRDVFKNPITDPGKVSKKGLLKLIKIDNEYETVQYDEYPCDQNELRTVFENGKILISDDFDTIKKRAEGYDA